MRYCIRNSLKQRELYEYLKLAFVEVAGEELAKLDSEPTPSKICAMTGIQRRDVSRLLSAEPGAKPNRDLISRVIGLWQAHAKYRDAKGNPRVLPFTGREGEFADLVAEVSTDLNPYTVAFELQRTNLAEQTDSGMKLLKRGYETGNDAEASLRLLAQDSEILHEAVLENIFSPLDQKNLHVRTEYDNIPSSFEPEIRKWFLEKGGDFHRSARIYLSSLDRDISPDVKKKYPEEPALHAVIGSVSFISDLAIEEPRIVRSPSKPKVDK